MTWLVIGHVCPVLVEVCDVAEGGEETHIIQRSPPLRQREKPSRHVLRLVVVVGEGSLALTKKSRRFLHREYETIGGFLNISFIRGSCTITFQCLWRMWLMLGNLGSYGIGRQILSTLVLFTLRRAWCLGICFTLLKAAEITLSL